MIQLTRNGVISSTSEAEMDRLRDQFEKKHYLILPQLIERKLFETLVHRIEVANFYPRVHRDGGKNLGTELCMSDVVTTSAFKFLVCNPFFLRILERIVGMNGLGGFDGRVYRMTSANEHYDSWHNDCGEGRMVTMSINLTKEIYCGGALQIKPRKSHEVLTEISNTGYGDALLFRISSDLVHRVQKVEGDIPKTAFAGWFLSGANWLSGLRFNRY